MLRSQEVGDVDHGGRAKQRQRLRLHLRSRITRAHGAVAITKRQLRAWTAFERHDKLKTKSRPVMITDFTYYSMRATTHSSSGGSCFEKKHNAFRLAPCRTQRRLRGRCLRHHSSSWREVHSRRSALLFRNGRLVALETELRRSREVAGGVFTISKLGLFSGPPAYKYLRVTDHAEQRLYPAPWVLFSLPKRTAAAEKVPPCYA